MNQDQIKELRRLAEAASCGPWRGEKDVMFDKNGEPIIVSDGQDGFMRIEDERYVLAANPANIIALLDHITQLETRIAERDKIIVDLNAALDEAYP